MFTSEKHESQRTAIVKVRKDVSLATEVLVNMMSVCVWLNVRSSAGDCKIIYEDY